MEKAIETITKFLSQCNSCKWGREGNCEFLLFDKKIPSPENNPFLEDDVMDLSTEQRAFKFANHRGEPCEEQLGFEHFLRILEEQLEEAKIPSNSTELLRLIGKINRINSIILRSSDIIYASFCDIAQASIDKCLARIDYHFLEKNIDIEHVIKSVSSDYRRIESLESMYPSLIVKSYIKNAFKLEIQDLTSRDCFISFIAQEKQERHREFEEIEMELPLGHRNLGLSAIKEFKWIFSNDSHLDLIKAILVEFGYAIVAGVDPMSTHSVDDVMQNNTDKEYASYTRWNELSEDIDNSLNRNIADRVQSSKYLQSIILSTQAIARFYYPKEEDIIFHEAATLLLFLSTIKAPSYKPLINIWMEAREEALARMNEENFSIKRYLDVLRRVATDKAKEEGQAKKHNELTILNSLYDNMNMLAVHIAWALLRNFREQTVEDLQESCGVKISSTKIDDLDFVFQLGLDDETISKYRNIMANRSSSASSPNEIKSSDEDFAPYPSIMLDIVKRCPTLYELSGANIIFKSKYIKNYAIFLKELYKIVYKEDDDCSMQWKKVPIHKTLKGTVPTATQLSNGLRNYDIFKDASLREGYFKLITEAYNVLRQN